MRVRIIDGGQAGCRKQRLRVKEEDIRIDGNVENTRGLQEAMSRFIAWP